MGNSFTTETASPQQRARVMRMFFAAREKAIHAFAEALAEGMELEAQEAARRAVMAQQRLEVWSV